MSEEQQGWWIEAAERAVEEQIAAADEIEANAYEAMKAEGLIVVEDVDREAFREAVQPMYEKYRDIIGADFMDEVLSRVAELEGE